MEIYDLIYIVIVHFLFDWILQPRWVAAEKTENLKTALLHGLLVSAPLFVIFSLPYLLLYGLLHGLQDRYLYNVLNKLWNTGDKERDLVNHVAIDQTIHFLILILLYNNQNLTW